MKTLKLTKILSLVLACVLLMGAFGTLPVFAADSDATIEIVGKNIAFGDTISLAYAVDCSDENAEIEVLLYDAEGTLLGKATKSEKTYNGCPVYLSAGVPAHKIDTVITAVATIKGTNVESAPVEYSVLEYLFERLEVDAKAENTDVTAEQIAMYEALMTYAVASELVLEEVEDGEEPDRISDYTYLAVAEEGKDVVGQIVKIGTVIYELETTLVAEDGYELVWVFNGRKELTVAELAEEGYTVDAVTIAVPGVKEIGSDEPVEKSWKLVTDVLDLEEGMQIAIVAHEVDYALSTNQKSNNRGAVAFNKVGEPVADVQIITLMGGTKSGTWAFYVEGSSATGYLYTASTSGNQLKTKSTIDDNGSWAIEIDANGVAHIKASGNNRPYMQYNPNNGSPLFACYSGETQGAVAIYAKY